MMSVVTRIMRTLSTILWLKIRRKKKKNIETTGLLESLVSDVCHLTLFRLDMHRTSNCLHFVFVLSNNIRLHA